MLGAKKILFSRSLVNRWKRLDLERVDAGSINSLKITLHKTRKTRVGFYGFCMVHNALGFMELGPRGATESELECELLSFSIHADFIPVKNYSIEFSTKTLL